MMCCGGEAARTQLGLARFEVIVDDQLKSELGRFDATFLFGRRVDAAIDIDPHGARFGAGRL
jgi:hypothetical protein